MQTGLIREIFRRFAPQNDSFEKCPVVKVAGASESLTRIESRDLEVRNMHQIALEIPGEVLLGLRVPLDKAGEAVRMAAAVKLFEIGQLSSGAAARLAGVPRVVFLSRLAEYGVDTFRLTEEQLAGETRVA